jgi:hypothetical protein
LGALYLALDVKYLVKLSKRLLLVHLILSQKRGQPLGLVLKLPLQVREARLRFSDFRLEKILLVLAQPHCLLVLHHKLRREEGFADLIIWLLLRLNE